MAEQRYRFGGHMPESVKRMKERRAKREEIAHWLKVDEALIRRSGSLHAPGGVRQATQRGTPDELSAASSLDRQELGCSESELRQSGLQPQSMRL